MQSKWQSGVCPAYKQLATKHRLTCTQQANQVINTTIFQEKVGRKVIGVRRIVLWPLLQQSRGFSVLVADAGVKFQGEEMQEPTLDYGW